MDAILNHLTPAYLINANTEKSHNLGVGVLGLEHKVLIFLEFWISGVKRENRNTSFLCKDLIKRQFS
jgi:hypothetical protein